MGIVNHTDWLSFGPFYLLFIVILVFFYVENIHKKCRLGILNNSHVLRQLNKILDKNACNNFQTIVSDGFRTLSKK